MSCRRGEKLEVVLGRQVVSTWTWRALVKQDRLKGSSCANLITSRRSNTNHLELWSVSMRASVSSSGVVLSVVFVLGVLDSHPRVTKFTDTISRSVVRLAQHDGSALRPRGFMVRLRAGLGNVTLCRVTATDWSDTTSVQGPGVSEPEPVPDSARGPHMTAHTWRRAVTLKGNPGRPCCDVCAPPVTSTSQPSEAPLSGQYTTV